MALNDYTLMLCAKIEKINKAVLEFNQLNDQDQNVWSRAIIQMENETNTNSKKPEFFTLVETPPKKKNLRTPRHV